MQRGALLFCLIGLVGLGGTGPARVETDGAPTRPAWPDKSKPTPEAVVALALGDERETLEAGKRLAREAEATRANFEVLLTASRRDNLPMGDILCDVWAMEWGERHKGRLDFLKVDAKSLDAKRRILAKAALGLLPEPNQGWILGESRGPEEIPVLATNWGYGDPNHSWVPPVVQQEDLVKDILGRPVLLPEGKVTMSEMVNLIEKGAQKKVVWYPDLPGVDEKRLAWAWRGRFPDRKGTVFTVGDICRFACRQGAYFCSLVGRGYQDYVVIFTQTRVIFVAVP